MLQPLLLGAAQSSMKGFATVSNFRYSAAAAALVDANALPRSMFSMVPVLGKDQGGHSPHLGIYVIHWVHADHAELAAFDLESTCAAG